MEDLITLEQLVKHIITSKYHTFAEDLYSKPKFINYHPQPGHPDWDKCHEIAVVQTKMALDNIRIFNDLTQEEKEKDAVRKRNRMN